MSAKTQTIQGEHAGVFVSHAHKDRRLAEHFAKLLTDGIGLNKRKDVFCSSLPQAGIQSGEDEVAALRDRLKSAKVFIALVTPNYLGSPDCNAEMGYIWAEKKIENITVLLFSFKIPPGHRKPFYFSGLKNLNLEVENDLLEIRETFDGLHISSKSLYEWNLALQVFRESAAKAVPDAPETVDYASMGRFVEACERYPRVLFFNVQVSFEDWFRPEMQTHLALQDATTTSWQLGSIVNKRNGKYALRALSHEKFPAYYGTPTARVLFVTDTRDELIRKLRGDKRDIRNFIDLALIHLFMATPLAIVTLDQLSKIILSLPEQRGDIDFRTPDIFYGAELGIPEVWNGMEQKELTEKLRSSLDRMFMLSTITGDAPPSIDFALLMNNRGSNGDQNAEVWRAGLTETLRELHYYQVPSQKAAVYYAFGKRIEHSVFKPLSKEEVKKTGNGRLSELLVPKSELEQARLGQVVLNEIALRKARNLMAKRHPCFKVFHEEKDDDPELRWRFASAMKFVWPQYCPLNLIMQAGGVCGDVYDLVDFKKTR